MKRFFLLLGLITITNIKAQNKAGIKIGYIDMEYILENTPDYKEASSQLEEKAQKWKQDIETKKNAINKLKETLKSESALLTKELIKEREEEIKFQENQLLDYQQKRFGSRGDLALQKEAILKPVQDQVFNAVQDLAEKKQYDYIFDKSSAQLTMLFSAKRFDISDLVVRIITRAEKREELNKKQQKALEEKEAKEDEIAENTNLAERKKILDEKKSRREQILEARRSETEKKRRDYEEKRKKQLEEQEAKKTGITIDSSKNNSSQNNTVNTQSVNFNKREDKKTSQDSTRIIREAARQELIEKNKKTLEERKKALEEKRKKILEDKEAQRKAQEEKKSTN
ncbi:OmpH family outer membrane protein [Flavobacterium columnare]|uniref:OmpH family outer membrane protein n=2 Tax=Flavobacterium TaxID=237 RepID=A0ABW8PRC5_9FLAO|nr:OmpH family outer membrane protein [Flavobacterium columnare]SPE76961.1 Outer membrane protein (OmpH-like) [Flavobacterium columnare]